MAAVQPNEPVASENAAPENGDAQPAAGADDGQVEGGAAATEEVTKEEAKKHPTGRTVIVRNIPPSMLFTYQEDLKNEFSKYGSIGYVKLGGITVDSNTVNPTLTAFMNFADPESSDKAMESNGVLMGGNQLQLQVLRSGEFTAVVNNVPAVISEEALQCIFAPCGQIKKIVKIPARPTAFVEFEDEESLNKALSLSGNLSMNNTEINLHKQGTEIKPKADSKNKLRKAKLAAAKAKTGPAPRGAPAAARGRAPTRGGAGRGSAPRGGPTARGRGASVRPWNNGSQPWGGSQYNNQWDDYGRNYDNNWGNGNFNSNDGQQFKRRKPNNWAWQY